MMKFTAVLTSVALACAVAASAAAQRGGMRGQMGARGMGGAGGARAMVGRQLFRGITLSDSQKTQLEKLRGDNRTQMQALEKTAQADRQTLWTARENGDTVALKAARQRVEGAANRRIALRGVMQRQVRAVLTPAQQKVFDANRTRIAQRMSRSAHMARSQRVRMHRWAMMRARGFNRAGMMRPGGYGAGAGMHMRSGGAWGGRGGFGPGAGMPQRPGRGGFGPGMQRRPGGPPPDSTQTGGR